MRKSAVLLVVLGIAAVGTTYAAYKISHLFTGQGIETPGEGGTNGSGTAVLDGSRPEPDTASVTALGRLEPADGIVLISGIAGDRLEKLKVKLGERVTKDQELAVLASNGLRLAELHLAETQLDEARGRERAEQRHAGALLAEARLAAREVDLQFMDVEAQREKVALVQANLAAAERNLLRQKALSDEIVSEQQREQLELAVQQARAEVTAAKGTLTKLTDMHELAKEQAAAKLETAQAAQDRIPSLVQVDSLEKSVELARERLKTTIIVAPQDGEILQVFSREGETLGQQPILQLADTSRMVAVAEVYEDQVLELDEGQEASVESDALGGAVDGKVTHVGRIVAKNSVISLAPSAAADLRVVEVRVQLEPNKNARRLINLQVTVEINTRTAPRAKPAATDAAARTPSGVDRRATK